jgi:hypothetical protein
MMIYDDMILYDLYYDARIHEHQMWNFVQNPAIERELRVCDLQNKT